MTGCEQAIDLAKHACRGNADAIGFGEGGLAVTHSRVELRKVNVLHLNRAPASKLLIKVLTRTAEWLPGALLFGAQAIAVRSGGACKESFVKLVAVGCDVRQQVRKRNIRAVASWSVAGRARGHEDC